VGSLATAFNREAMDWFLAACWGNIRRSVPEARLLIVGRGGERYVGTVGVEAPGFVADLAPFYLRSRLAIAPLLSGSGTRLKIVEALAYRRPVVATSVGAEGLELPVGAHLSIANSPTDFVAECVKLLENRELAASGGDVGRAMVEELYDWDMIAAYAASTLSELHP